MKSNLTKTTTCGYDSRLWNSLLSWYTSYVRW